MFCVFKVIFYWIFKQLAIDPGLNILEFYEPFAKIKIAALGHADEKRIAHSPKFAFVFM